MHINESNQSISVGTAVLTVGNTRTPHNVSGKDIQHLLTKQQNVIHEYCIVNDEISSITSTITSWCNNPFIQVTIITGGTSFIPREVTYEATSNSEKEMLGFGELFRSLSYTDIVPKTMFSKNSPVSTHVVKLAINNPILPTCRHFVKELNRQ
ncbi:molybdenum cofactor biosynthesis protein B [Peribacillus sp. NPDC060186]